MIKYMFCLSVSIPSSSFSLSLSTISGAGTDKPFGEPEFTPGFCVAETWVFCVLFVFVLWLVCPMLLIVMLLCENED